MNSNNNYKIGVYNSHNPYSTAYRRQEEIDRVNELAITINTTFDNFLPNFKQNCIETVMRKFEPVFKQRETVIERLKDQLLSAQDSFTNGMDVEQVNETIVDVKGEITELKNNVNDSNNEMRKFFKQNNIDVIIELCKQFEILINSNTSSSNIEQLKVFSEEMGDNITGVKNCLNYYVRVIMDRVDFLKSESGAEEYFDKEVILAKLKQVELFVNKLENQMKAIKEITYEESFKIEAAKKAKIGEGQRKKNKNEITTPIFFRLNRTDNFH
jgi:hypothetical protein